MNKVAFEEKLSSLNLTEFSFNDQKIKYIGEINKDERKELKDKVFGFYKNENDKYICFIYNLKEDGLMDSVEYDTEDEMFDEAFNLIECEYYMAWCKNVQAEMNDKITQLIKHLNEKYGQNILKAAGTIKKLMKADTLMIELLFHMDHDRFVPNKFAMNINGNTVENIYSKENISVLEAFEKMASLKK